MECLLLSPGLVHLQCQALLWALFGRLRERVGQAAASDECGFVRPLTCSSSLTPATGQAGVLPRRGRCRCRKQARRSINSPRRTAHKRGPGFVVRRAYSLATFTIAATLALWQRRARVYDKAHAIMSASTQQNIAAMVGRCGSEVPSRAGWAHPSRSIRAAEPIQEH
jgi:hypothetical protein